MRKRSQPQEGHGGKKQSSYNLKTNFLTLKIIDFYASYKPIKWAVQEELVVELQT